VLEESLTRTELRIPKAAEVVASHLRRRIVRRELVGGETLPPEHLLLETYGVSRPTLREALRILEAENLISIRRGSRGGASIIPPSAAMTARYATLVLEYNNVLTGDIVVAQSAVECEAVYLLAQTADAQAVTTLRSELDRSAARKDQLVPVHVPMHQLLVELCGNQTLGLLAQMLERITHTVRMDVAETTVIKEESFQRAQRDHEAVVNLIEQGLAEEARQLWTEHSGWALESTGSERLQLPITDLLDHSDLWKTIILDTKAM
jgi:DNA-binding FadR family transcriptional regulator